MKYFSKYKIQVSSSSLIIARLNTFICTLIISIVLAREMSNETRGYAAYIIMAIGLSISFATASKVESIFRRDSDSSDNPYAVYNIIPSFLLLALAFFFSNNRIDFTLLLMILINVILTYFNSVLLARIFIVFSAKALSIYEVLYNLTLAITILIVALFGKISLHSLILCSTFSEIILFILVLIKYLVNKLNIFNEFHFAMKIENPFSIGRFTAFIDSNISQIQLMIIGVVFGMKNLSFLVVASGAIMPILIIPRALMPIILGHSEKISYWIRGKISIGSLGIFMSAVAVFTGIYACFLYYAIPFIYGPKYDLLRGYVIEISFFGVTSAFALLNRILSRGMKLFTLNFYYNLFSMLGVLVLIKYSMSSENFVRIVLLSNSIINITSFLFNRIPFKRTGIISSKLGNSSLSK